MANESGYDELSEWNNHKIQLHMPAIAYVSVLMIFGSFGNIVVCVYYGCKSKRSTKSFFIVALAAFDLVVCLITMPLDIVDLRFFFVYTNVPACKIPRFLNHIAAIGSASTLIAIAVDRYKRICKPLTPQLEIRHARIAIVVAGTYSLLISWPSLLLYDSVKVNVTDNRNISRPIVHEAYFCTTSKAEGNKDYIWAYNSVLLFVFLSAIIVLCTLYSLIGRSIYRYKQRRLKYTSVKRRVKNSVTIGSLPPSDNECLNGTIQQERGCVTKGAVLSKISVVQNADVSMVDESYTYTCDVIQPREYKLSESEKSLADSVDENSNSKASDINTVKFTVFIIIVTIMFIVSYLPYVALVVWRTLYDEYEWNFLNDSELLGFQIGLRSYLLSSTTNPIVYGFFNDDFRKFFYWTFCPCFVKSGFETQKVANNHRLVENNVTHM